MTMTLRRRVRELARAVARVAASTTTTTTSASSLSSSTRARWGAPPPTTPTPTVVGRASTWTRATMAWTRAYAQTHETARSRVNDEITAETVRLVRESDSGESTHEILPLGEAIEAARAMGLDLVEVNGKASPPVCRAMDYERVRYDQKKRVKEQKKASAAAKRRDVIKELRLTAKIDAHDLNVKINGARKFLDAGHRVTFRILFKNSDGIALEKRPQRGAEIMDSVMGMLDDVEIVVKPKMVGPSHMTASVKRPSGKKK